MRHSVRVLGLTLLMATPALAQNAPVRVPFGGTPHTDGQVHAREWSGATEVAMADRGEVLLVRDENHVYVALRLPGRGIGSVCVERGDDVRILHASMALGTAVYRRDGEGWQLVEPFRYTMRETDDSPETQQKRAEFLATHKWVASTMPMGEPEAVEYKIDRDLFDPHRPVLGVVAMITEPGPSPTLLRAPARLDDGCGRFELVQGGAREREHFDPAQWLQLKLHD